MSDVRCSGGLPEGQPQSDCRVTYLPVRHIPFFGRNLAARFHVDALRTVKAQIAEADVILASWLYPDGVAAARLGAELNVPVWIMVLGSDVFHLKNRWRRSLILDACSAAQGIVCVAQHLKDALVEAGAEKDKIHVVYNGVDASMFCYDAAAARQNEALWIGNMVEVKAPDVMLEVWEELADQDLYLTMIGDGPLKGRLERRARRMKRADRIRFTGSISHSEIAARMKSAKLLCLTSRSEGMPNVVLEALACGTPVVAFDVGCVRDMLKDYEWCRVVERGERFTDNFAEAVAEVLKNGKCDAAASKLRSWDDVAAEIMDLMQCGGEDYRP